MVKLNKTEKRSICFVYWRKYIEIFRCKQESKLLDQVVKRIYTDLGNVAIINLQGGQRRLGSESRWILVD